ncbi:MAG: hypothetical protein P8Y03_10285 [Anaerolineales bacterium]|jgi:hypothetical protein
MKSLDDRYKAWSDASMRAYLQSFSTIRNARLLKNEILSSSAERGIGNARVSWTDGDGKTWACDFIYEITLDSSGRCNFYKEWNVIRSKDGQ